jgi:hypothetical protein
MQSAVQISDNPRKTGVIEPPPTGVGVRKRYTLFCARIALSTATCAAACKNPYRSGMALSALEAAQATRSKPPTTPL